MYCPKCGLNNEESALFCIGCGQRLQNDNDEGSICVNDDTMKIKPVVSHSQKPTKNPKEIKPQTVVNPQNNSMKTAVIILSVILAIAVIALVVLGIKLFAHNSAGESIKAEIGDEITDVIDKDEPNDDEDIDDIDDKDDDSDEDDEDDDIDIENFSTIPIDSTNASSERTEDGITFGAHNINDSKMSTAWSPSSESGVGDHITLGFNSSRNVHGIRIANGYQNSTEDYYNYGRAKRIVIKFSNGKECYVELKDGITAMQDIRFDDSISCQNIELLIDSVYSGSISKAVYISEIEVY